MAEVEPDLLEVAMFIAEEIILELVKNRKNRKKKNKLSLSQIERLFSDLISKDKFEAFKRCLLVGVGDPVSVVNTVWKEFVKSISAITFKRGKYSCDYRISPRVDMTGFLGNLSSVEYRNKLLSEMLKMLLDGDLKDINCTGENGNTVLHLLAALPMETRESRMVQIDLLKLLVEKKPDCSRKNDQDMTPLHIIAGNYLLDPNNNFVVSEHLGLNCTENTIGRCEKLSCIENIIDKPVKFRGPNGNSILHEWVICHNICKEARAMPPSDEVDNSIGHWIISIAGVQPNVVNDHGCMPLHYAFTDNLVEFLCKNVADTRRPNVDDDTPLMYIIKHGVLPAFVSEILPNGWELEETLANKFSIQSVDPNLSHFINYHTSVSLKVLEEQGFDFSERDSSDRHCLDYFLLFVQVLVKECERAAFHDVFTHVMQEWIMELAKNDELTLKDGSAKEKVLSVLIIAIFESRLDKKMLFNYAKELLDAGANPNHYCDNGIQFLHYSCEKAMPDDPLHVDLLKMLCEYGADKNRRNQDGSTPIQMLHDRQLDGIIRVVTSTKPKQRVLVDIQSQRYKVQLDQLSREISPRRIEELRYDRTMIGKGSMSCVYLAIDEKIGKEVALKRALKTSFYKEIAAEIKALNQLEQTQNVVNLYYVKEDEDFYFIALELMDGDLEFLVKTKAQHLQDHDQMCDLAKDILRGLEFLHNLQPQYIIHRDLKPGNILYRENPELCLKLADFGLAKHLNVSSTCQTSVYGTSSTSMCGTRGWMAPELVTRTQKTPSKESDMFALGLVLHFLFSKGFHPCHSCSSSLLGDIATDNLRPHELEFNISQGNVQIHADLNPEQRDLVKHLLNKDPSERPPSKGLMRFHCYFWSNFKKVYFMWKVGDQPEVAKPSSTPASTFAGQLQNSPFGRTHGINWNVPISHLYQEVVSRSRRKYDTSSVVGLIRFFRNCYAHFEERSPDRKNELLKDHFFVKFPDFFLTVYEEVYNQGWANPGSDKDWIVRMLKEMD